MTYQPLWAEGVNSSVCVMDERPTIVSTLTSTHINITHIKQKQAASVDHPASVCAEMNLSTRDSPLISHTHSVNQAVSRKDRHKDFSPSSVDLKQEKGNFC